MIRNVTLSQNALAVLTATVGPLQPVEIPLSSLTEDRMLLKDLISRVERRGCVPFEHARLEELMIHYERGTLSAPGPGTWVFVTDRWENGVFCMEFKLPAPVSQQPVLMSVGFNKETNLPYGAKRNFVFNKAR